METIQVSSPKVMKLHIDVVDEKVVVMWAKTTASGIAVEQGTFTFWKTLPLISPLPPTWYQLDVGDLNKVIDIIELAENFVSENV